MFENIYSYHMWPGGYNLFGVFPWIVPFVLAELVLKGVALWKSARNNQQYWFIALLVINSAGILPLLYLISFQKRSKSR